MIRQSLQRAIRVTPYRFPKIKYTGQTGDFHSCKMRTNLFCRWKLLCYVYVCGSGNNTCPEQRFSVRKPNVLPVCCSGFPLKRKQLVMVAQLSYLNGIIGNSVNDSMFIIYTAGPISGECMLQRLGLANSFKWAALNLLYQGIYTVEDFFIGLLPIKVVLPGMIRKD